jgi:hypothetical protein
MTRGAQFGGPASARSELLTTAEAAQYLRISPETWNYWRSRAQRRGPRYIKIHAHGIRYRLRDLDAYIESRLVEPAPDARRGKRQQ